MRWLLPLLLLAACSRALDTPAQQVACEALTDEAGCVAAGCEVAPSCSCPNESIQCVAKGTFFSPPSCSGACAESTTACDTITDPDECTSQPDCYALLTYDEHCNSAGCESHFAKCLDGPPTCNGIEPPVPENEQCDAGYVNTTDAEDDPIGCVAESKCPGL